METKLPGASSSGIPIALGNMGKTMGSATRDIVYTIGKMFGVKFRPWGAVNLASKIARFGAVLSAAALVFDVLDVFYAEQRLQKADQARRDIADKLRQSIDIVATHISEGDDNEPGVLRYLDACRVELEKFDTELSENRKELAERQNDVCARRRNYHALMVDALRRLGVSPEEEGR